MSYRPTPAVQAWFEAHGFIPCPGEEAWNVAYAHSNGHGHVTLRFWPHAYGWDAIVADGYGPARRNVSLGTCQTIEQMQAVLDLLHRFDRKHYVDAQGQRQSALEPLVENV